MLDIKIIRDQTELVKKNLVDRGMENLSPVVDEILELDGRRRELLTEAESIRSEQNSFSEQIQKLSPEEKKGALVEMRQKADHLKALEEELRTIEKDYARSTRSLPNLLKDDVKIGRDESANEVIKMGGAKRDFDFNPRDYITLGTDLDLIDTARAAKVSGARFAYLKNEAVWLAMALTRYAYDFLADFGFIPVMPPVMIGREAMEGMGYLSHGGEEEIFKIPADKLYLVGTSEQSIGPMHAGEILSADDLPKKYLGYSSCFRREAGSYGKDVKGIMRLHQFEKVEMFMITKPEDSDQALEDILEHEIKLMSSLDLPFRVIKHCSGDTPFVSARSYDIEVFIPSEDRYRETHSCSNVTDFQSRRLKIRYKTKEGENKLAHMLNGTAFALQRMLIAIFENYQQRDGSIKIPEVLQKYLPGREIISPEKE